MNREDNLVFTFCFELWFGCDDRIPALEYFSARADRYDPEHSQRVWIELREETMGAVRAMKEETLLLMVSYFPLQLQTAMA